MKSHTLDHETIDVLSRCENASAFIDRAVEDLDDRIAIAVSLVCKMLGVGVIRKFVGSLAGVDRTRMSKEVAAAWFVIGREISAGNKAIVMHYIEKYAKRSKRKVVRS